MDDERYFKDTGILKERNRELGLRVKGLEADLTHLRAHLEVYQATVTALQDKALRFDLDQAGIERREAEAVELVELRATVTALREKNVNLTLALSQALQVTRDEDGTDFVTVARNRMAQLTALRETVLRIVDERIARERRDDLGNALVTVALTGLRKQIAEAVLQGRDSETTT